MEQIIIEIYKILNDLKKKNVLADTRVKTVSLYDHLVLTSGIAVATLKELLARGKKPEEICGKNISEDKLLLIVRVASLLHDWGKDHEEAFKNHQKRSVEKSKDLLEKHAFEQTYIDLVLSGIERHHFDSNPRTLLEKIVCLADSLASAGDRPELAKANTTEELSKISETSYNLFKFVFEGEDGLVLILGDVDKVKSYVYETTKLPEIRGASEILNDLNYKKLEEIFEKKLSKECLIYKGGGSFLAISPKLLADDIKMEIEHLYLSKTKTATITCVKSPPLGFFEFFRGLRPYDNEGVRRLEGNGIGKWLLESHFGKFLTPNKDEWFEKKMINDEEVDICKRKGFGELVSKLSAELRKEKDRKENTPFFEALPIGRRCQSCGKRVASEEDPTREEKICEVCYIKRTRGVEKRLWFRHKFDTWLKERKIEIENIFDKFPKDLDDLAGKYENYMAFIYADGNDIGELLNKARSPAHYRCIAEELKIAIEKSLFEALFETFKKDGIKNLEELCFEIINIGGDDISVIIAAPFAFNFSLKFLERFKENTKKINSNLELPPEEEITISLGMVICKSTYPVYYAEKIAESLLKDAKSKWKKLPKDKKENTLSYLYLTSSIASEDGKEILKDVYENEKRILTLRPYTQSEFELLLKKSRELKALEVFTATQRNSLLKALSKGRFQSTNYLFYQIARMKKEKKEAIEKILNEINSKFNSEGESKGGWTIVDGKDATPLVDLLEFIKIEGDIGG